MSSKLLLKYATIMFMPLWLCASGSIGDNAAPSSPDTTEARKAETPKKVQQVQAVTPAMHELITMPPEELAKIDIARINLLCAEGLPGAESLDIKRELETLDRWAKIIEVETARSFHQFREHPEDFNNSEAYFRILLMITVLQRDLGVRYNPERINSPDFSHPEDLFVHGMTHREGLPPIAQNDIPGGGTCVSMPVLYAAIARRLGYPVKLVTVREHVFNRWEDKNERFNIEGTNNHGLSVSSDEYYRTWPNKLTEQELASGAYLRSLSPTDELAMCLTTRGYVLHAVGHESEAMVTWAYAHMLDPKSSDHFDLLTCSVNSQLKQYPVIVDRFKSRAAHAAAEQK